jgi:hypothetical protein
VDPGTSIEGWYTNCTAGSATKGCMPNGLIIAADCM